MNVKTPEKRRGWYAGVSMGHYITMGTTLVLVGISYGVVTADVKNNAKNIGKVEARVEVSHEEMKEEVHKSEGRTQRKIKETEERMREDVRENRSLIHEILQKLK